MPIRTERRFFILWQKIVVSDLLCDLRGTEEDADHWTRARQTLNEKLSIQKCFKDGVFTLEQGRGFLEPQSAL